MYVFICCRGYVISRSLIEELILPLDGAAENTKIGWKPILGPIKAVWRNRNILPRFTFLRMNTSELSLNSELNVLRRKYFLHDLYIIHQFIPFIYSPPWMSHRKKSTVVLKISCLTGITLFFTYTWCFIASLISFNSYIWWCAFTKS